MACTERLKKNQKKPKTRVKATLIKSINVVCVMMLMYTVYLPCRRVTQYARVRGFTVRVVDFDSLGYRRRPAKQAAGWYGLTSFDPWLERCTWFQ